MRSDTFELLDWIDKKNSKGKAASPRQAKKEKGIERPRFEAAEKQNLIKHSNSGSSLTSEGYRYLLQHRISKASKELDESIKELNDLMEYFSETSEKLDKKMIKHTERLNWLTVFLLIAAVLTLITTVVGIAF